MAPEKLWLFFSLIEIPRAVAGRMVLVVESRQANAVRSARWKAATRSAHVMANSGLYAASSDHFAGKGGKVTVQARFILLP